jgi:hypothetical protein
MEMTIEQWLDYGKAKGFCSEPVCDTHDGATNAGRGGSRGEGRSLGLLRACGEAL